jgi:hypothetical protein
MQHDGGCGELVDVALAVHAFANTIHVHTAGETITYNPDATPADPWHLFNNARGRMTGTHWHQYAQEAHE